MTRPIAHFSALLYLPLAVLVLAACQPVAPAATHPPTQTAGAVGPTASMAPIEPTMAISQATPTGEGPAGENLPACWMVFKHATLGYALTYPLVWENTQKTQYSQEFTEIQQEPGGMGPPLRLYVSVYPMEYTNQTSDVNHIVEHFIPLKTIREFMALRVGESKLKDPDSPAPATDTYTRLPDRQVAGESALVIENAQVWEAPIGTKDRIVVFITNNTIYLLGMNYETPEQLAMFERVLDSFKP